MTKEIRAVIIDDDLFVHEDLIDKLEDISAGITFVGTAISAIDGLTLIHNMNPHLVFLDIQMPGMNGFELLDHVEKNEFAVIFITSHNQYAIQAIRYSALDYLLKPIDPVELSNAVGRYKSSRHGRLNETRISNLQHNMKAASREAFRIIVPTRTGEKQFSVNDIIRLEADSNYTWLHLNHSPKFLASKTLKEFEEMLNKRDFIRAHKSHLVNRKYVESLTSEGQLLLKDTTRVEVSRRRMHDVRAALTQP